MISFEKQRRRIWESVGSVSTVLKCLMRELERKKTVITPQQESLKKTEKEKGREGESEDEE